MTSDGQGADGVADYEVYVINHSEARVIDGIDAAPFTNEELARPLIEDAPRDSGDGLKWRVTAQRLFKEKQDAKGRVDALEAALVDAITAEVEKVVESHAIDLWWNEMIFPQFGDRTAKQIVADGEIIALAAYVRTYQDPTFS